MHDAPACCSAPRLPPLTPQASQAQSRAKQLEKLKASAVEIPAAAAAVGGGDFRKVALRLPKAPPVYTEVIKMTDAAVGWGTPDSGNRPIVDNVNFIIRKGQRVLVSRAGTLHAACRSLPCSLVATGSEQREREGL